MGTLRTYVTALGPIRLAVLLSVLLGAIGFLAWVVSYIGQPDYALLYGDLDMADSARIVTQLEASNTPYRLESGGATILVPRDKVARTRVALAEKGVPAGASLGYEIFDTANPLGTTSFLQNVNLVRALEGELGRTIRGIATVKAARVHLVLPKRETFSRERQEPSASVLIQTQGGGALTPQQVLAIQNLVASAVPGLKPARISIVDSAGSLLTDRSHGEDEGAGVGAKAEERRRRVEAHLARTVEQLLEKVVGPGRVRAEVAADMDFDRINTSQELFDPDGQVARSTRSVEEAGSTHEREGSEPVSVATSLPDAAAGSGGAGSATGSSEKRNEETVNYEISKKIINHVREVGAIKRLSVAVLVDNIAVADASGATTFQPRSAAEIEQLTALVRSAIGFNGERGDRVEVVNMRFADEDVAAGDDGTILLGLDKNDLIRIAQLVVLAIVALLVLLTVVRPIVTRALEVSSLTAPALLGQGASPGAIAGPAPASALLPAGGTDEAQIDVDKIDDKMRSSAAVRVGEIIEKHPEETLAIVRGWLQSES